jgi:FlaG/FlaF family flagellin (archaellin)
MEGISSIIVVLLILLITLALAAGLALFLTSTSGALQNATETQTSQAVQALGQDFSIEAVRGGDIYIRNKGSVKLSGLSLYVDDVPLNTTKPEIPPGTVGVIHSYDFIDYSRGERTLTVKSSVLTRKTKIGPENQYPELVAYWKFDEGSGTIASDSSLYGNNGTFSSNAPNWVDGKYGKALNFNGYSRYVSVGNSSIFRLQNLTITAWINRTGNNEWARIVSKTNYYTSSENDKSGWNLLLADSNSGYGVYFVINKSSTNTLCGTNAADAKTQLNKWYFVAASYDGSVARLYLNGTLVSSATCQDSINYVPGIRNVSISAQWSDDNSCYFPGIIDDVRIWSRALTPEEIWNQYIHGPI